MSFVLGLAFYLLFLVVYWFFVVSVLWHLKEYTLPVDYSAWVVRGVLTVIILLNIISLILFFQLPLT